jgi:16S rRNA processing protein RimM
LKWDDMALVGRIARPHGIRGQVIVNPETDFPEDRFSGRRRAVHRARRAVEALTVTTARFHRERPVIGIDGVETMTTPRRWRARAARAGRRLAALPPDTFYRHDLIGCRVETRDGETVGVVTDVEGIDDRQPAGGEGAAAKC